MSNQAIRECIAAHIIRGGSVSLARMALAELEALERHAMPAEGGAIGTFAMPKRTNEAASPYCACIGCEGEPEGKSRFCLDHAYMAQAQTVAGDALCLFSDYDKGTCTLQRGHVGAHDFFKARGRNPDSPVFQEELRMQAQGGGIGTVIPPRPPKPCPHDNVGCGTTRVCEVCKGAVQKKVAQCMASEYQRGLCLLRLGHHEPHDFGESLNPVGG